MDKGKTGSIVENWIATPVSTLVGICLFVAGPLYYLGIIEVASPDELPRWIESVGVMTLGWILFRMKPTKIENALLAAFKFKTTTPKEEE
jgi:hypothetical protein